MVVLNYSGGEINAKIVYYGPGLSGKTTNLEYIHEKTPTSAKGKMVSMKTQTDRTLFFDFLPLELGDISGYRTRFLLYTVPGQVYYNATRKLVLKGVDALVFVADSSRAKLDDNLESLRNLEQNLNEHGLSLDTLPWVIQYNKRDAADAMSVRDLDSRVNPMRVPTFEAVATKGNGVYDTFRGIATMVYRVLKDRLERGDLDEVETTEAEPEVVSPPKAAAPPARPQPPRAPARAKPAPRPEEPVEERREGEHEFNHAVDMMLREVDESPSSTRSVPAKTKAKARPAEPSAAEPKAPRAPATRPQSAPPAREPAPQPSPPPAPVRAEAPAAEDGLFESIPDSPFDVELGRLPALDEAALASDTARDEGPDEFVTDPMRRPALSDTHAVKRSEVFREPAVGTVEAEPAPAPAPAPAAGPVSISVPVTIKRSQLKKAGSLRLLVDIRIED